ncbi:MAG: hypothetical protein H6713_12630 [Myxococcales bacterium]|nr:hypothetical protein [Myxococcales bacterium]MCB9750824.1 hypothetical protein [Myxococcales bacterium]
MSSIKDTPTDEEVAPARPLSAWDHARAALIALHVLAIVALAFPSRGALTNKAAWRSKNTQADFAAWTAGLNRAGVEITPQEFEAWLWSLAERYGRARDRVTRPVQPYARYLGLEQSWQMFASPQRHPGELHVDIRVDGEWRPIYRSRSREYTWRRGQLDYHRMRKYVGRFARGIVPGHYNPLARALARAAASDFPEAESIRVRLYRYRSLPPDRVRAGERPEGRYEHTRVYPAAPLRAQRGAWP